MDAGGDHRGRTTMITEVMQVGAWKKGDGREGLSGRRSWKRGVEGGQMVENGVRWKGGREETRMDHQREGGGWSRRMVEDGEAALGGEDDGGWRKQ